MKTEQQLEEEIASREQQQKDESARSRQFIQKEFFEPRRALFKEKQIQTHGMSLSSHGKLGLFGVSSPSESDPMEILFGPSGARQNHVVQQIGDYELRVVRWNANPERLLGHLFEPFPGAGASLEVEKRFLSVERDRTLFPDPQKSYAFCNLAAGLFNLLVLEARPLDLESLAERMWRFRPKLLPGSRKI